MSYKDWQMYQKAYALNLEVYSLAKGYPKEELFGMTSQMKRASMSIVLNIAESYSRRGSDRDVKRFLVISIGSCDELNVLLDMSRDVRYISEGQYAKVYEKLDEVRRMLVSFKNKLRTE